jgi:hopene-associated glycosyltransferase HpnB
VGDQPFIYPDIQMLSVALIAGLVCVTTWVYLLVAHGRFWRIPLPSFGLERSGAPSFSASFAERVGPHRTVAVIIPARNEAAVISRAVSSLLRQAPTLSPNAGEMDGAPAVDLVAAGAPSSSADFAERVGRIHIFVVDDNSTDRTADAARQAAEDQLDRVTVIDGHPLPPGWSGKLWAVQQGVEQALGIDPDFLLLTDADIEHDSHNVAQLVAIADQGYDIASFMVKLHCRSVAERMLIPAFVFFFFMLYPPEWIRDPRRGTAGAAGGCILIRPSALKQIGGLAAIRGEIIDDCALARAVKKTGGRVWLGTTADTHSVRPYKTFGEIERMIARTAFNQLQHSFWLLLGTVVGMLMIYVLPLVLLLSGSAKLALVGAAAYLLMGVAYLPMVRFYGLNVLSALTLPFSAAFYTVATIHSALKYWTGRGGEWKGRAQDRA